MEEISPSLYQPEKNFSAGRPQPSYWEKAFELAELPNSVDVYDRDQVDIEYFVNNLATLTNDDGKQKYPYLVSLYKCVLSLSHGNSAPENGFSINKRIIDIHGNSIQAEIIQALRLVKDTIIGYENILNIPITKDLLDSAKSAYQRYSADLEMKRKLKEDEEKAKKQAQQNEQMNIVKEQLVEEKERINQSIAQVEIGLSVADDLVIEGNNQLKALLTTKNATKKELIASQSKIETGTKRRGELLEDLSVLNKRKKEIGLKEKRKK